MIKYFLLHYELITKPIYLSKSRMNSLIILLIQLKILLKIMTMIYENLK